MQRPRQRQRQQQHRLLHLQQVRHRPLVLGVLLPFTPLVPLMQRQRQRQQQHPRLRLQQARCLPLASAALARGMLLELRQHKTLPPRRLAVEVQLRQQHQHLHLALAVHPRQSASVLHLETLVATT